MNWIKRNWRRIDLMLGILGWLYISVACFATWQLTAHAQKPQTFEQYLKEHPVQDYTEPVAYLAQKPEPPKFVTVDSFIEFMLGKKNLNSYINQHCVAVTSPAHDIDWDKINEEARNPHTLPFYQRSGKEHVPEQTSRIRCQ